MVSKRGPLDAIDDHMVDQTGERESAQLKQIRLGPNQAQTMKVSSQSGINWKNVLLVTEAREDDG